MDHILTHKQAPIPHHARLYADEGSNVERYELLFHEESKTITENYLVKMNTFFEDIKAKMDKDEGDSTNIEGQYFSCDVYFIESIVRRGDTVLIHDIIIRPCAWHQGFFRKLMFNIIEYCKRNGWSLKIVNPSLRLSANLRKISTNFKTSKEYKKRGFSMDLSSRDMRSINEHGLRIDHIKWPAAKQLNNKEYVDSLFPAE
jgi:GNAT superfamily N-acetyltransferase